VLAVLEELGYVEGFSIRPKGEMLARIYGEGDILVAEAIDAGLLGGLAPPRWRRSSRPSCTSRASACRVGGPADRAHRECYERSSGCGADPLDGGRTSVQLCRELDTGFATPIYHWAQGQPLEAVLRETEMAPGDFVRNCKQLLDLLRQIEEVAPPTTAALVRARARGRLPRRRRVHGRLAMPLVTQRLR
jgi:ATP-dependent RNA helicase HelY